MSKIVRSILILAFLVFVAGVIWVLIAAHNNKKQASKTPTKSNTPTLIGEPSSTTTATTSPVTPVSAAPTNSVTKKAPSRSRTIITEQTSDEFFASAWASAGTNPDGSSWAEAHAD